MPTVERLKRQLLELGVVTLITAVVWIGYGVYYALTEPADVKVTEEELRPIPTNLDLKQLEALKERLVLSEDQLNSFMPPQQTSDLSTTPTPSELPSSSTTSTSAATVSVASPSASLP